MIYTLHRLYFFVMAPFVGSPHRIMIPLPGVVRRAEKFFIMHARLLFVGVRARHNLKWTAQKEKVT